MRVLEQIPNLTPALGTDPEAMQVLERIMKPYQTVKPGIVNLYLT